jgi:hypothetical protein
MELESHWHILPNDMVVVVLAHLSGKEIARAATVSKELWIEPAKFSYFIFDIFPRLHKYNVVLNTAYGSTESHLKLFLFS